MIKIRNLYKSFAEKKVLQGVNLDIDSGQTTTIIGGSGSGKSVLFKHIIGLMQPDSGSILVEGEDITKMKESALYRMVDKFGMVFQSGALFDSLTVGENVAFGIKNRKHMEAAAIDALVERSLNQVGLSDIAHLLPAELSGGMKKRVAIARVIAKRPSIIMFDEPTTGLDPIMADMINELIIKVSSDPGITSIVITHDMVSAYKISDKIAVLFEGEIIEIGSPGEIRSTRNAVVRQFIEGKAEGPIKIR
ncbi:MAG TPA: ATP-binding cassette domain-containing protein [Patescibacteria group bacterium]|nr:ATP-binding cassette domain-containing protein [Patescibacteria group bacterium]